MRTVIFDLDGTLIDTEKYFKVFWRKAAAAFGYSMSEEQALQLRSLGRPYAPALLQEWFGEEFDYLAVREVRRNMMKEFLAEKGVELKPGAKEALSRLKQEGCKLALATATLVERASRQLKEAGIYEYFDEIVSAAGVERGKPAPDVYLAACRLLGELPEDCVAVEDSPNGVKSAYNAGLRVVMIPDQTEPDRELRQLLYACIPSLRELPEAIKERPLPEK